MALVVDEGTDSAGADIVLLNFLVAAYLAPLEVLCLLLPVSGLVFGCLRLVACRSGHYLNSILLTFQNQGSVRKSAFSTNAQSRFASVGVDGVLGPPRLAQHTLRCPCISVVPEATDEASRGSETETKELLGGAEENRVSPTRGH